MKISKSKKELACIISENGGWPFDAEYSSQDGADGQVSFFKSGMPIYNKLSKIWNAPGSCVHMYGSRIKGLGRVGVIKNFHQTILSRAEYFNLYPSPDADGWIEWKGGECPAPKGAILDVKYRDGVISTGLEAGQMLGIGTRDASYSYWQSSNMSADIIAYRLHKPEQAKPEFCESVMRSTPEPEYKPSIEQLMQIHCDRSHALSEKKAELIVAERQESEALDALKDACKEAGFDISPVENMQERQKPELVITDWRDLRVGDEVEVLESHSKERVGHIGVITRFSGTDEKFRVRVHFNGVESDYEWISKWRFIRRP